MTTARSSSTLVKVTLRIGLGIPLIALIIILPSGTWNYWQGWMYLATLLVPMLVSVLADVVVFTGYIVFFWMLTANSFLSRTVEVDAGQKVITTSPYAIVRHPMYLVWLCSTLAPHWRWVPTGQSYLR